jgi:hypothetical protein
MRGDWVRWQNTAPQSDRIRRMANPNPSMAAATPGKSLESPGTWIDISAASPLFAYEPQRNDPGAWSQDTSGGSTCSGGGPYAVGIDGVYCE